MQEVRLAQRCGGGITAQDARQSSKAITLAAGRLTPRLAPWRSCTPAPPREAVGFYNLVGDPGRKNGEKKLKHQILRTAEWASPHARATLVRQRSAAGAECRP